MHKQQGLDVQILASTENYGDKLSLIYVKPSSYVNEDGIKVTRIPYIQWLPNVLVRKLRIYSGIKKVLENFQPDILFLHDCQFLSIYTIRNYVKKNPSVKIFVDGHTDFHNSAKGWVSKNILHKIIYRHCVQLIYPFVSKFYGVSPPRCDFFYSVYGVPAHKIALLPLGVDLTNIDFSQQNLIREKVRKQYHISNNDLVFVTGGKIDQRKLILPLISIFKELNLPNVKLLVFGKPSSDVQDEFNRAVIHDRIVYAGWQSGDSISEILLAADCAIFPGTHSVLWEQVVGLGIPAIFRKWPNMTYLNVHENCCFLESGDRSEILDSILRLISDPLILKKLLHNAQIYGRKEFSYFDIAKKAIGN
jgi:glycosyltransferase involved in cell wall biosynthesis